MEMQSRANPGFVLLKMLDLWGLHMRQRLIVIAATAFVVGVSLPYPRWLRHREAILSLCDLVLDRFYLDSENLWSWFDSCQELRPGYFESHGSLRKKIQSKLAELGASHLMIYTPAEDRRMWMGRDQVTGLQLKDVEGHAIVFAIMAKSPAEKFGFKVGDEILAIQGRPIEFIKEAETQQGDYLVRRLQNGRLDDLMIKVETADVRVDGGPALMDLNGRWAVMRVSSFRAEYFSSTEVHSLFERARAFAGLVLDLRGNSGGNLVAMMRLASGLTCEPKRVGEIVQPRTKGEKSSRMADDLDEGKQLGLLSEFHRLELITFAGYKCFKGPVVVLIDHETSSVSEILAEFLKTRANTQILGEGTSGDVLLAAWYDFPALGKGSTLSIPESLYLDHRGLSLERAGVLPDRSLSYDLELSRRGKDSMLNEAIQSLAAAARGL